MGSQHFPIVQGDTITRLTAIMNGGKFKWSMNEGRLVCEIDPLPERLKSVTESEAFIGLRWTNEMSVGSVKR